MKATRAPSVNDARRLLAIISRAGNVAGTTPAAEGWLTVVGIGLEGLSDESKLTLAYEVIADFRRLLDRIESRYGEVSTSTGFRSVVARFRHIATGQYAQGNWDSIQRQFFAEQNVVVIEAIADALPDEGGAVEFDATQTVLTDIESLLAEVRESDLPPYHKRYAEMMLERLRSALRNSVFYGKQSAHEYAMFVDGLSHDMNANSPSMKREASELTPAGQSLIDRIKHKVGQATDISKSVYYIGGAAAMAYHGAEKAIPLLLPFFGGK